MTDRERLYIQATYARDLGHIDEAIERHRLYLSVYPDDATVRYSYATMLMLNQRLEAATDEFAQVIFPYPRSGLSSTR